MSDRRDSFYPPCCSITQTAAINRKAKFQYHTLGAPRQPAEQRKKKRKKKGKPRPVCLKKGIFGKETLGRHMRSFPALFLYRSGHAPIRPEQIHSLNALSFPGQKKEKKQMKTPRHTASTRESLKKRTFRGYCICHK